MRGITNAPQGSGGGSGGSWTERAANNDWTDIFDITGNVVTAKKDVLINGPQVSVGDLGYVVKASIHTIIPKGTSFNTLIWIPCSVAYDDSPIGRIFDGASLQIAAAKIQYASAFNIYIVQYKPTLNGTDITYTVTRNNTGTVTKSSLKVFTRD